MFFLACAEAESERWPRLDPDHASAFGQVELRIDLEGTGISAAHVDAVDLGGVATLDLRREGETVVVTVQGSPEPGPVELGLVVDGSRRAFADAFSWEAAPHPSLDHIVVVGASVAMGLQSAGVGASSMRQSPPAVVARQLGAWLGLPLWSDTLFPPIAVDELGAAPDCTLPDYLEHVLGVLPGALAAMDTGSGTVPGHIRADPELAASNLAVAGTTATEVVQGYEAGEMPEQIFAKAIWAPEADLSDTSIATPLEVALAAEPSLVLVPDLFGNDLVDALQADVIDLEQTTDPDAVRGDLAAFLDAFEVPVFIADTPRLSHLGLAEEARRRTVAAGATEAEAQALLDALDEQVAAMNEMLGEVAEARPHVRRVRLWDAVEAVADGVEVGDEVLRPGRYGGLVGLDGLHFTATGNAMVANVFLEAIGADLGLEVELADLAEVAETDPATPANLRAAGFDPALCD